MVNKATPKNRGSGKLVSGCLRIPSIAAVGATAASLVFATPALAADQFDLVCTGKKETQRYRIDLQAGEWCFGRCERVMKIAQVTSGMITLLEDKAEGASIASAYNRINRVTGDWEWYARGGQNLHGQCSPADFSGFGTSARKF